MPGQESTTLDVGCIGWSGRSATCRACGACGRKKVVGELDAGNPRVQFDEGMQETYESSRDAPVFYSTLVPPARDDADVAVVDDHPYVELGARRVPGPYGGRPEGLAAAVGA